MALLPDLKYAAILYIRNGTAKKKVKKSEFL